MSSDPENTRPSQVLRALPSRLVDKRPSLADILLALDSRAAHFLEKIEGRLCARAARVLGAVVFAMEMLIALALGLAQRDGFAVIAGVGLAAVATAVCVALTGGSWWLIERSLGIWRAIRHGIATALARRRSGASGYAVGPALDRAGGGTADGFRKQLLLMDCACYVAACALAGAPVGEPAALAESIVGSAPEDGSPK